MRNKVKLIISKALNIKINSSVFIGTKVDHDLAQKAFMHKKRKFSSDMYVGNFSEWDFGLLFAMYVEIFVVMLYLYIRKPEIQKIWMMQ